MLNGRILRLSWCEAGRRTVVLWHRTWWTWAMASQYYYTQPGTERNACRIPKMRNFEGAFTIFLTRKTIRRGDWRRIWTDHVLVLTCRCDSQRLCRDDFYRACDPTCTFSNRQETAASKKAVAIVLYFLYTGWQQACAGLSCPLFLPIFWAMKNTRSMRTRLLCPHTWKCFKMHDSLPLPRLVPHPIGSPGISTSIVIAQKKAFFSHDCVCFPSRRTDDTHIY